jgi:hypothetical protein
MAMGRLEAMRTFVRVVERGSFSAVAKKLGATQSRGATHPRAHVRASPKFRQSPLSSNTCEHSYADTAMGHSLPN